MARKNTNEFTNLRYTGAERAARQLAEAFVVSNSPDELWACLRYLQRREGHNVMGYLDGMHFSGPCGTAGEAMADRSTYAQEVFEELKCKAITFLGEDDVSDTHGPHPMRPRY